jgi:hypothetical protein
MRHEKKTQKRLTSGFSKSGLVLIWCLRARKAILDVHAGNPQKACNSNENRKKPSGIWFGLTMKLDQRSGAGRRY